MKETKTDNKTAFENFKKIEETKKKQLMSKILTLVKNMSKEIQENKELCNMYLEEISIEEKEKKRIIDWINNLPDVQPDEDRKKELKEQVKSQLKSKKSEIERKIEEKPEILWKDTLQYNTNGNTWTTGNATLCSNTAGIEVN